MRNGGKKLESGAEAAAVLFDEAPAFGVADYAFSFAFELKLEGDGSACTAFRLERLDQALDPARGARGDDAQALWDALIAPIRSYHDDVTNGPPGKGGRPLIFAAAPPSEAAGGRRVAFVRPARWSYQAENRIIEMRAGEQRRLELEFRDFFCAFASGRLFYVMSFFPADEGEARLDEYTMIWLAKLALASAGGGDYARQGRFEWRGGEHELPELAQARLDQLGSAGAIEPNGLTHIVRKRLMGAKNALRPLGWESLRSLAVGLDDERAFNAATFVEDLAIAELEPDDLASRGGGAHNRTDRPAAVREAVALAGILQAVPDFPMQDRSEIWDSTRAIFKGDDFHIFAHPGFTVEIGKNWRTLGEGRDCLGHCPYFLLMWLVALHDEIVVTELERGVEDLLYGDGGGEAERVEPLAGLARLLDKVWNPLASGPTRILRRHVTDRFELFRRLSIARTSRILRYEKEARTLAAMQEGMGTPERFRRAHEMLDRLESLVEDVHELNRTYSGRQMNRLLGAIAAIGVIGVVSELMGRDPVVPVLAWSALVLIGLVGLVLLVAGLSEWLRRGGRENRDSRTP